MWFDSPMFLRSFAKYTSLLIKGSSNGASDSRHVRAVAIAGHEKRAAERNSSVEDHVHSADVDSDHVEAATTEADHGWLRRARVLIPPQGSRRPETGRASDAAPWTRQLLPPREARCCILSSHHRLCWLLARCHRKIQSLKHLQSHYSQNVRHSTIY